MVTFVHAGSRVDDYDQWKKGFDASGPQRKTASEVSYQVLRDVDNPGRLTIVSVQENADLVTAFMNAPTLRSAMKAFGVAEMG